MFQTFIFVSFVSTAATAFSSQNAAIPGPDINAMNTICDVSASARVWDNTLTPETLTILHKQVSQRGLGHNVFNRSNRDTLISPIEQAIDDLLTKLNDQSPIVEYWSRQEWKHIEAHADIDELLVREQQKNRQSMKDLTFRYPRHGHVLYLQVGSNVQGPTCLFSTCRFGGDLIKNLNLNENENEKRNDEVPVITVPAVPSRLLRFRGDILHAVPRPADIWFRKFVVGTGETEPIEEWGRSVILFNTWEDEDKGPLNVFPVDTEKEMEFMFEHEDKESNGQENGDAHEKDGEISNNIPMKQKMHARNIEDWQNMPIHTHVNNIESKGDTYPSDEVSLEEQSLIPAKIWLLGDYARRNCQARTVKLNAPELQMRKALEDRFTVYQTFLKRMEAQ